MPDPTVVDATDHHRFEALAPDGTVLGVAAYRRRPGVVVFTHTEVDAAYEGQGIGSTLVAAALDAVRAAGERIVPLCPFVRRYVADQPEYADLVMSEGD
ncbi:GNAT family N-acetyltransferase [Cellulomonas hominis]|uniref:GNAT family N-acetyltransferase n=1 Tax=Cellulomonas hominis TaxID=156981 RepID=UPI0014439503|nr:GNAT family N-acetyltransferase [Cellulomonas hominis]NKY11681.1 N-acetyltransferase [Cellulomonas hominis]